MMALPESVIERGVEGEAFYANQSQPNRSTEGRFVRQHISREWLSGFHEVMDQELRVLAVEQLNQEVQNIVEGLPQP